MASLPLPNMVAPFVRDNGVIANPWNIWLQQLVDVVNGLSNNSVISSGVFRNAIANGNFDIWQRGTVFNSPVDLAKLADCWNISYNGTSGTFEVSKRVFAFGDSPPPGSPRFYLRFHQTVGGVGNTFRDLSTQIEGVETFEGLPVIISLWAKAASPKPLIIKTEQYFGSGGSPSASVFTTSLPITITTEWTRLTFPTFLQSMEGKTLGANGDDTLDIILSLPPNDTFDLLFYGVQIEAGNVLTDFEIISPQINQLLCQRRFQKSYDLTTDPTTLTFVGTVNTTQFGPDTVIPIGL